MAHSIKICSISPLTHDVIRLLLEKPAGLEYTPGQAVDLSINQPAWEKELRPFTFTSLPGDPQLEFTIKTYPDHQGVTQQLRSLQPGEELLLHDVFGDIHYQGEGIFIAGGAGVTPFIAILRQLEKEGRIGNNKLIFANKTRADIIHEQLFRQLLGDHFINVLSDEESHGYEHGYINTDLVRRHLASDQFVYLCGPPPMMEAVEQQLASLDVPASRIVKEAF